MSYLNVIVREPNIALLSLGIYSKSDKQHHLRTQQFHELITKMNTIQCSQLTKTCKNSRFFQHLTTRLQWYFKDIKDYIYLNGEKYRPQRSPTAGLAGILFAGFVNLKNEVLSFLGWPYYILEKLTLLYARCNFFLDSSSQYWKESTTHAQYTHKSTKQASVAHIFTQDFFWIIFSNSINKIPLDSQISEYNKKLSTIPHKNLQI